MTNPDGVVMGNSRASISGQDLNRRFHVVDEHVFPECSLIKSYIKNLNDVFMCIDLHAHAN